MAFSNFDNNELGCDPLIEGGQGRSAKSLEDSAKNMLFGCGLFVVFAIVSAIWALLEWLKNGAN